LTEPQAQQAIMDYQKQRQHDLAETNLKQGEAFLAQNKGKEGVKVQPVALPDGRMAELQYKIITEGTGEIPKSNDTVNVNYRGTLINGTEFDSSAKRGGRPYKFTVNQPNVPRGWTEALQMMTVGSKWELYIPASLAFDERPRPVPPGSTVVYELELVDVEKPKPLTSDIIRVPSAEEMKAGAKIEVIKAEDAEKMAKTNQVAPEKK
jgi:FKBP-type peptidyl-prolyl cis-trans isomerase